MNSDRCDTLRLVDASQRDVVAAFPRSDPARDLAGFRRHLVEGTTALVTPEPVPVEERCAPGIADSPPVRLRIHHPPSPPRDGGPAILYAHGGGLIAGTAAMMDGSLARLAAETGALVAAVDYRLAPEHPFPAAQDDFLAALVWLRAQASTLEVDGSRIAVMGDSAGGTLAAATALLARERGDLPLRAQILLYPALDIRTGTSEHPRDPLTGQFIWTRAQNRYAWDCVRGDAPLAPGRLGILSPSLVRDLAGLPPSIVMVGALDLFRPEDVDYARRLMEGGVATDLFVHAGGVHGFDTLGGALAARARSQLVATIRALL